MSVLYEKSSNKEGESSKEQYTGLFPNPIHAFVLCKLQDIDVSYENKNKMRLNFCVLNEMAPLRLT